MLFRSVSVGGEDKLIRVRVVLNVERAGAQLEAHDPLAEHASGYLYGIAAAVGVAVISADVHLTYVEAVHIGLYRKPPGGVSGEVDAGKI